jgi:hypothetical protein
MVNTFMDEQLLAEDIQPFTPDANAFNVQITDAISSDEPGFNSKLKYIDPVHHRNFTIEYTHDSVKTFYDKIASLTLPDNFTFALFALPTGSQSLTLKSTYGNELIDHAPSGQVYVDDGDGGAIISPLSRYQVTAENVNSFEPKLKQTYVLAVYPKNCAGLSVYSQNFVAYQIEVTQTPIPTEVSFVMDGSLMTLNALPGPYLIENCKAFYLSNIYAEDADKVSIGIENDVISLTGERAQFYSLANHTSVKYQQRITASCYYKDDRDGEDESDYAVAYKGASKLDFVAPDGDSIVSITIMAGANTATLMEIADGDISVNSVTLEDGTSASATVTTSKVTGEMLQPGGAYTVHLWDISSDITIEVCFKHGDNGTVAGCTRCRGYVDASQYDYIEWVPICTFYRN